MLPSEAGLWARRTPSNVAPSRSMAARDAWFRASVLSVTRSTLHTSKACRSMSSLHSSLTPVR